MTENLATLIKKRGPIRTIGVIGMGYVGIPAVALFRGRPALRTRLRLPAGLRFFRLQDHHAQPRRVAAQGRGARA